VVTPWATILDAELLAIRARHAAQLAAEHRRIAVVRQRAEDARIVAQREARISAQRAVTQAREAVTS
jgi:hypothetical protein